MNSEMPGEKFRAPSAQPGRKSDSAPFLRRFFAISGVFGRVYWARAGRTFFTRLALSAAVLCVAMACTGAKDPKEVRRPVATPEDADRPSPKPLPPLGRSVARPDPNDWSLETHRTVALVSQNLVLSVPQGHVWESLSRRGTWSGLRHAATESELWVRHAPARRTVSLDECEKEARLSWPLLRGAGESRAEDRGDSLDENERTLRAPKGYGGKLSIVLNPEGGGRVEAFSVGVSRCLAVVFRTGGAPGFPERLRVAANEVIETMRVPNVGERSRAVRMTPY